MVRQCLAWFSLGCASTIWAKSVVLNSDAWVQAPFQAKFCRITVNLILPSPLAWERPNNYRFGEVAQLGE